MPDKGLTEEEVTTRLGISSDFAVKNSAIVSSITKTLNAAGALIFECKHCNRKFRIVRASPGGAYKCISCHSVLEECKSPGTLVISSGEAELILDEAIPPEVRTAMKNPENVFNRYITVKQISESSFKAFDVELARFVTLKVLKDEEISFFKTNLRTLAALEHKNIGRVYDVGIDSVKGVGFITMQHIDGRPLSSVDVNQSRALEIVRTVCEAVNFAHRHTIIHRGINPEKIIIDNDGNIFVVDFGMAPDSGTRPDSARLGAKGEVKVGSALLKDSSRGLLLRVASHYISPEVLAGRNPTAQSDVYSIAATLQYLLARKQPADAMQQSEELMAIANHGLIKDPAQRYQSPFDMAQDILRFQMGYPVDAFSHSPTYRLMKAIKRNKVAVAIGAAVIVALAAIAYYIYSKHEEESRLQEENKQKTTQMERAMTEKERIAAESQAQTQKVEKLISALITDLSHAHEEALARRKSGDNFANLRSIPERVLASPLFKQEAERISKSAPVLYSIGHLYRIIGDYDRCEEYISKALNVDARFGPACYESGMLLTRKFRTLVRENKEEWIRRQSERAMRAGIAAAELIKSSPTEDDLIGNTEKQLRHAALEKLDIASFLLVKHTPEHLTCCAVVSLLKNQISIARQKLDQALEKDRAFEDAVTFSIAVCEFGESLGMKEKLLTDAVENDKGNTYFLVERADFYNGVAFNEFNEGRDPTKTLQAAIIDLGRAIELRPDDKAAYVLRGIAWNNLGKFAGKNGKDPDEFFSKSGEEFRTVLKLDSDNSRALEEYSALLSNIGVYRQSTGKDPEKEFKECIEICDRVVKLDPNGENAHMRRADAFLNYGACVQMNGGDPQPQYAQAIKSAKASLQINASSFEPRLCIALAQTNIALFQLNAGEEPTSMFQSAEESFKEVFLMRPKDPEALENAGILYMNWGGYKHTRRESPDDAFAKSERCYTQLIEFWPDRYDTLINRGTLRNNMAIAAERNGKDPDEIYSKGAADFLQAARVNSASLSAKIAAANLLVNWGNSRQDRGLDPTAEYSKAQECIDAAFAMNGGNPEAWDKLFDLEYNRGIYLFRKSEYESASAKFDAALKVLEHLNGIDRIYEKKKKAVSDKLDEARRLASEKKDY